jgi:hypothetical protein
MDKRIYLLLVRNRRCPYLATPLLVTAKSTVIPPNSLTIHWKTVIPAVKVVDRDGLPSTEIGDGLD